MEKKKYELVIEVVRRLHSVGILNKLVLIGSWCMYFYEFYFHDRQYSPTIRTRDMDILIPLPCKIKTKVDLRELLKDLGFIVAFASSKGYLRLDHPDLILELLVPERGRGSDEPYNLPNLGMNAQPLRYLDFLAANTISLVFDHMTLKLPHPAAFALHKLIVMKRRIRSQKALKDRDQALLLMDFLVKNNKARELKDKYLAMHPKWRKMVVAALKGLDRADIINLLTQAG